MNNLTDNLRSGLAALAGEVRPVDLHGRALRASRRLAVQRVLVASGAGAVVLAVLTTAALAWPSQREAAPVPPVSTTESPSPTGSPTPSPTPPTVPALPASPEIPVAAMLPAEDLGPGYRADDDTVEDHGSLSMLMAFCGQAPPGGDLVVSGSRLRAFESGDGSPAGQQEVYRYEPDGALRAMANLRTGLVECPPIEVGGNPDFVSELTLLRSEFAGDESMLLREVYTTPDGTITRHQVALRQDDLYAQLRLEGVTGEQAVAIATAAAQRLCEATSTC